MEEPKLANWFACPLCGHQRRIEGWDPESYADQIKIRDVRGLGKGHGSGVASEWAANVDSAGLDLEAMAKRCLKIVELCLDTGEVSADDLVDDVPDELVKSIASANAED